MKLLPLLVLAFPLPTQAQTPPFQWSSYSRTVTLDAPISVPKLFDGAGIRFLASPKLGDGSQKEGQKPLFILAPGATTQNVLIGFPAADGIHVNSAALRTTRIRNCQWLDVGEDSITIRGDQGKVSIENCQFQYATDTILKLTTKGSKGLLQDIQQTRVKHAYPTLQQYLAWQEEYLILKTLEHTDGNREEAALLLGISIASLYRKMPAREKKPICKTIS